MTSFNNIIHLISKINKNDIELELKFLVDKKIKTPYFIKNRLNIDVVKLYLHIIDNTDIDNIIKSQTINFIKNNDNYSTVIKQLHFNGDIQLKELKSYYIKKSIIPPVYLDKSVCHAIKMSLCSEKKVNEFNDIKYNLVRFKNRTSIKINKNWRLDITLIKESYDINVIRNINTLKSIIKEIFCDNDNYKKTDKIEFEMEFIGDLGTLTVDDIKTADIIFNDYVRKYTNEKKTVDEKKSVNEYTKNICLVANLLKPNLLDKFKSGYFGLKQLGSNPIEISKSIYYNNILPNISKYIITDKIDGIRSMIFIYIDICYVINNKNSHSISELKLSEKEIANNKEIFNMYKNDCIILDAELIQAENKPNIYYVFDVIKYFNIDVCNFTFDGRLEYINKIVNNYTFLQNKKFTYIENLINKTSIKDYYTNNIENNKKYPIDGLIIFNRDSTYNETKYYKWKPICTIDFYARRCPNKILGIDPYLKKPNKTLYILFSGINDIDYSNLNVSKGKYYYDILDDITINKKYFPIRFKTSDNPYAYLFWYDDDSLDNKIIELTYDTEWKFIKIRHDRMNDMVRKTYYGNYLKYAELIWFNIQNKLNLEDMTYENMSKSYFKNSYNDEYSAMRKFNNFTKMKLIELNSNTICLDNIVDICSGRGQDLQKYINCGFKNIFMFDNDIEGIIEIINRKYLYSKNRTSNSESTFPNIYTKRINFLDNPKTNINIIKNLLNVNKVKFVVCNFALHYLVYNKTKLNGFTRLLNDILDMGGVFIFTSFDGKKVFDLLLNTEYTKFENGKKKYSIKKKYSSDEFTGIGHKIEVLLPFSDNEYYPEYLINIDIIKSVFKTKGINLMIESSFSEYLKSFKEEKKYFYDNLTDIDKEYIDLHKFYIFHKTGKKKM